MLPKPGRSDVLEITEEQIANAFCGRGGDRIVKNKLRAQLASAKVREAQEEEEALVHAGHPPSEELLLERRRNVEERARALYAEWVDCAAASAKANAAEFNAHGPAAMAAAADLRRATLKKINAFADAYRLAELDHEGMVPFVDTVNKAGAELSSATGTAMAPPHSVRLNALRHVVDESSSRSERYAANAACASFLACVRPQALQGSSSGHGPSLCATRSITRSRRRPRAKGGKFHLFPGMLRERAASEIQSELRALAAAVAAGKVDEAAMAGIEALVPRLEANGNIHR